MAIATDNYCVEIEMTLHNPTQYYPALTQRLIAAGIHHSKIFTGWGQVDGIAAILCCIAFYMPKNSMTEAQVTTIGNDLAAILGKPLVSIHQWDTNQIYLMPI